MKILHEIKVKAEPSNLPHQIEVDISPIAELEGQILAKDVAMPKGVELMENPEEVVAAVEEPKPEEAVETSAEPVDLSTIEVEKKGKKEEETAPEK